MNELIKTNIEIVDMIYEMDGIQVMLDSEISVTECHDYFYNKIVTHYDIGIPISMIIRIKFFRHV